MASANLPCGSSHNSKERKNTQSPNEDKNKPFNFLSSVQFDLLKPVSNFFGRNNDIDEIHTIVQKWRNDMLRLVIHGMTGLGKSETIRQYYHRYADFFDNNVLWVKAFNQTTLESSFIEIADIVGLAIRDGDHNLKGIKSIIKSVHKHFQNEQILYIFDDVTDVQILTPFLPKHKPSASIIATQLKDWSQHNNFQTHELQTFQDDESTSFLKINLVGKTLSEAQTNCVLQRFEGHPLALQQFIVCITKTNLSVEGYLEVLEKQTKELPERDLVTIYGGISVIGSITINVNKLAKSKNSKLAIDLLNTISYFYNEEISFDVLKLTFPNEEVTKINSAVKELESYSLVKTNKNIISLHSLIQKSMIFQHHENDNEYYQKCLRMFLKVLDVEEEQCLQESFGKEWYKHLIYFITTNIDNTEIQDLLYENFYSILNTLKSKGSINELINFTESLLKSFIDKNGRTHEKTLNVMFRLAYCYQEDSQNDKAARLYEKVLVGYFNIYGKDHKDTLDSMNNMANCLRETFVEEAIVMYEKAIEGYTKIYGENHKETLERDHP